MIRLLIYIAIICVLMILVWKKPANTLTVILCLFAIDQWGQISSKYLLFNPAISNIILGLLVVLGLARGSIANRLNRIEIGNSPVFLLVLLLIVYAVISTIWSPVSGLPLDRWIEQAPYFIIMVVCAPILFKNAVNYKDSIRVFIVFSALLLAMFVFLANWQGRALIIPGSVELIALPLALAQLAGILFISAVMIGGAKDKLNIWIRVFSVLIAIILVFKTSSRGQFISMVISTLIFLPYYTKIKNMKSMFSIVFMVIGITLIIYYAFGILISSVDSYDRWSHEGITDDLSGRIGLALKLLSVYADSGPVTWLVGLGSSASYATYIVGHYPHVIPLEILGEEGIVGIVLFIAIFIKTFGNIKKTRKLLLDEKRTSEIIAIMGAGSLYLLILSFKSGALVGASYMFLFPILIEQYYLSVKKNVELNRNNIANDEILKDTSDNYSVYSGVRLKSR